MIDIVGASSAGLEVYPTQVQRAANILAVQLGALEYAPELGIDLRYFLTEDIKFQDGSFKAYLVQTLANNGINVASLIETLEAFMSDYTFKLTPEEDSTGFVVR